MIALCSLLFASVSTFGGGTMDDLAKSLADETGKNSIIVTGFSTPKMEAFKYDNSTPDTLATSIYAGAKVRMAPGGLPYFSDRYYNGDHFREIAPKLPPASETTKVIPAEFLTGGKVTLETASKLPILLEALTSVKWSHPLRVDYMLRDLAVSASVKNMPERDFLDAVARSAGAFVTTDDTGYHMAYDGDQLRTRVLNTLKQQPADTPVQIMDCKRDFYIAVVGLLAPDALNQIFSAEGLEPRMNVLPNTDLAQASIAYVKAVEAVPSVRPLGGTPDGGASQLRGRGNRGNTDILSHVDNRAVVHLRMNSSGEIVLSVPVIEGRQSTYIEI
jgi:hypothetical protein